MKKKTKRFIKIISTFLAALILIGIIPSQVFAAAADSIKNVMNISAEASAEIAAEVPEETAEATEAEIIYEDVSKRDAYSKQFKMSDGTYQIAQYSTPVHYLDENNAWVDYDNSLTEVQNEDSENKEGLLNSFVAGLSSESKDYTNNSSDSTIKLSKKTNGKKFVSFEHDGYKISWYYENAKKQTGKISNTTNDDDPSTLEKLISEVTYNNVFSKVDFQYLVSSNCVKENILLNAKSAQNEFTVQYKCNGLTAVSVDDKTVEFRNEQNVAVFTLNAPVMYDDNGASSDSITLVIVAQENGKVEIKLTADRAWLDEEGRKYPVTVDPMFQTSQEAADMDSAFVSSQNPNKCYRATTTNDSGSLYVGNIYGFGNTRSYIKFSALPQLKACDKIVDAKLCLALIKCELGLQVEVRNVSTNWNSREITWNNSPTPDNEVIDYLELAPSNAKYTYFEITDLVKNWYNDGNTNKGLALTTKKTSAAKAWFCGSYFYELENKVVRPLLQLSYRNMSGYEDYYSYTSVDAGRYGKVSVNNYNGNTVSIQPITLDAGGNLSPVNISLIYNSNVKSSAPYTNVGMGWQTNYHLYIKQNPNWVNDSANSSYKFKYYFNDADGTQHYLYASDPSTATVYTDEDGLGYELHLNAVGAYDSYLVDKDKNKIYFDGLGMAYSIKNPNEVSTTIAYETVNGVRRINYITDGAGRVYEFNYPHGDVSLLGSVTDPSGRSTHINYAFISAWTVGQICYPDQLDDDFYYYADQTLAQVISCDNMYVDVNCSGPFMRVDSLLRRSLQDSSTLEMYSYAYNQNETTITNFNGNKYTYQFNDWGQTTGVVSNNDGQAQFVEYTPDHSTSAKTNKPKSVSKAISSTVNYFNDPSRSETYLNNYSVENTADSFTWDVRDITDSSANTPNSLEVIKVRPAGHTFAYQSLNTLDGAGTYTLSANVNTFGESVSGNGIILGVQLRDTSNGALTPIYSIPTTHSTDGWERLSVTFDLPNAYTVSAMLGIHDGDVGAIWFDDIQLEKGSSVNNVNLLTNSSFNAGTSKWTVFGSTSSVNLSGNELPGISKAMKFNSPTSTSYSSAQEYLGISGSKGDVYSFGMWTKALSAPVNNGTKLGTAYSPSYDMKLIFYKSDNSIANVVTKNFNCDINSWQFLSAEGIAEADYAYMRLFFCYDYNVNEAYFAAPFCYKEAFGQTYTYDNDGNIISSVDLANSQSQFAYNGNQMAKMFNPSGSRYMYATEESTNNILHALSSDGQEYNFSYDGKGNVTSSQIKALKPATALTAGTAYYIVNAYSGNAIDSGINNAGGSISTHIYKPTTVYYPYQHWTVHSYGNDTFSFISDAYAAYAIDIYGANTTDGYTVSTHSFNQSAAQKFKAVSNGDGTFRIMTGSTNYTKCLDGQYDEPNKVVNCQPVKQNTYNEKKEGQKWYFYPVEYSNSKEISTTAAYTENGNFVSSQTDQRGNSTTYSYNETKGLLNSATDPLNRITAYTYNENDNLLSVSLDGMTNTYTYANDRLDRISTGVHTAGNAEVPHVVYGFNYDKFGRTTSTRVGNGTTFNTLSTYTYGTNNIISRQTYGNTDYVDFTYDRFDRLTERKLNGNTNNRVTYSYNNSGNIARLTDYFANTNTKYTYDLADRTTAVKEYSGTSGTTLKSSVNYTYADKTNYLTGIKHFSSLGTQTIGYRYGSLAAGEMPDAVYGVTWNGSEKVNYTYDGFGRLTNKQIKPSSTVNLNNQYTYEDVANSNKTTMLVKSLQTAVGTATYTYDALGNITNINDGTYNISYEYDSLNQVVRENNQIVNKTIIYSYANGNITSQQEYAYTVGELGVASNALNSSYNTTSRGYDLSAGDSWQDIDDIAAGSSLLNENNTYANPYSMNGLSAESNATTWTYGNSTWKDLLTNYKGQSITYDAIGNPLIMGSKTFSWLGRQLLGITDGGTSISYAYNGDGQRISKTVDGATTEFFYNGSILAGQKTGNDTIVFMYDNNGDVFGLTYNGVDYYYIKNAQNDVVAIADSSGVPVVKYYYYAYGAKARTRVNGNVSTPLDSLIAIANANPLRYRSYYFDTETGYYYLNSRYYSPEMCRFINADSILDNRGVNTLNLFAYCGNNPVNNQDPDGHFFFGALVGGIIGGAGGALTALVKGKSVTAGFLTGAATGAAIGLVCDIVATGGMSAVVGVALCGVAAGIGNAINQYANYRIERKAQNQNMNSTENPQRNNSSGTKTPTSSNGKLASKCDSFADYVDIKSIAISSITAMVFAPASMGANYVVNSAFAGIKNAGTFAFTAQFAANFAMGGNISILQSIIDLF